MMKTRIVDIETLGKIDRTIAEEWFVTHICDAAYPDMTITEDRSDHNGVAIIASCPCGAEFDLTDYASW